MAKRIGLRASIFYLIAIGLLAAALGYLLRQEGDAPKTGAHEKVIAKVNPAPRIPAFPATSGWVKLPVPLPPPSATESTASQSASSTEVEEAATEPEPLYEEPYVPETVEEPSSGGESDERCHGITFGPTC